MHVRKSLEKPTKILGMKFQELGIVIVSFVALTVFMSLLRMVITVPPIVPTIGFMIVIGLLIVVRIAEKRKHPSFLISAISFYLKQPKKIVMTNPNLLNKDVCKKKDKNI